MLRLHSAASCLVAAGHSGTESAIAREPTATGCGIVTSSLQRGNPSSFAVMPSCHEHTDAALRTRLGLICSFGRGVVNELDGVDKPQPVEAHLFSSVSKPAVLNP